MIDILIVFVDGSELIIYDADDFILKCADGYVRVLKNDHCQYYTLNQLRCIGRLQDMRPEK